MSAAPTILPPANLVATFYDNAVMVAAPDLEPTDFEGVAEFFDNATLTMTLTGTFPPAYQLEFNDEATMTIELTLGLPPVPPVQVIIISLG